ncbi:MAG: hypothetical protein ACYC09_07240 [Bacteroidota bacterium]
MDTIIVIWQEIVSLCIVAAAAFLLVSSEISKYRKKKLGVCSHDSDCAVAKLQSIPRR